MKISGFLCPHCAATIETDLDRMKGASYRKQYGEDADLWLLFDKLTGGTWSASNFYGKADIQCPQCGGKSSILVGVWVSEK